MSCLDSTVGLVTVGLFIPVISRFARNLSDAGSPLCEYNAPARNALQAAELHTLLFLF